MAGEFAAVENDVGVLLGPTPSTQAKLVKFNWWVKQACQHKREKRRKGNRKAMIENEHLQPKNDGGKMSMCIRSKTRERSSSHTKPYLELVLRGTALLRELVVTHDTNVVG